MSELLKVTNEIDVTVDGESLFREVMEQPCNKFDFELVRESFNNAKSVGFTSTVTVWEKREHLWMPKDLAN